MGSDVNKIFPYSALLDQLRKFGKFGLYAAILLLPIITTDASDVPDLNDLNGKEIHRAFKTKRTGDRVTKLLQDVILDMDRLGYI